MEEYDELSAGPDEDGRFNLSYNDWTIMPYDRCTGYSNRLIYLNISHNNIVEISDKIASLTLLKEINLSHNSLRKIDRAMGKCIRLRKIDVSNNYLVSIPVEILSKCKMLDSLHLQNNKLRDLPNEICDLNALEIVDVRNNNLEALPTKLHSIQCLKQILCQGNNEMTMIPRGMRGESGLVLWSLKLHQSFHDQITNANKEYIEMEQNGKNVLVKSIFLEEDVVKLKYTVKELERERPTDYIKKKESFLLLLRAHKMRLKKWIQTMKDKVGIV